MKQLASLALVSSGYAKSFSVYNVSAPLQTYFTVNGTSGNAGIGTAGYGEEIIKTLSADLHIHERTLYRILKFYKIYPILTTVLSELSWSHYLLLIDVGDNTQRKFYEARTVKESWSVREPDNRIAGKEYDKAKKTGEITIRPPDRLPAPEDVFKDIYNWDFIKHCSLKTHNFNRGMKANYIY